MSTNTSYKRQESFFKYLLTTNQKQWNIHYVFGGMPELHAVSCPL